jgi:hypothetical protein
MSLAVQGRNLLEKALDGRVVETVREGQDTDMGAEVAADDGAVSRTRTVDLRITNAPLYQLS